MIQKNALEDTAVTNKMQWDNSISFMERILKERIDVATAELEHCIGRLPMLSAKFIAVNLMIECSYPKIHGLKNTNFNQFHAYSILLLVPFPSIHLVPSRLLLHDYIVPPLPHLSSYGSPHSPLPGFSLL